MTTSHLPSRRVFLSHTAELATFPEPPAQSFVAAAIDAVNRLGHVPVDMRYFAAAPETPATDSVRAVRDCDVFLGIWGHRYGSIVPDDPERRSYTELEFDAASLTGKRCLLFLLDGEGMLPRRFFDPETAERQKALRDRGSHLIRKTFGTPEELGLEIVTALATLPTAPAGCGTQYGDGGVQVNVFPPA
jgi:hypothetical protein